MIGGELIINDSPSVSQLLKWREELPSTNHLARQLHVLRSQEAAPPAPPPPQQSSRNPGGGRELTQDRTTKDTGKKGEAEDDRPIGALSHLINLSADGKTCVIGRPETGDKIDLVEFRKKYPKACECTLSKHKLPYLLCPHAGKAGHTTKTSGARKIPKDLKTAFPLFLLLASQLLRLRGPRCARRESAVQLFMRSAVPHSITSRHLPTRPSSVRVMPYASPLRTPPPPRNTMRLSIKRP